MKSGPKVRLASNYVKSAMDLRPASCPAGDIANRSSNGPVFFYVQEVQYGETGISTGQQFGLSPVERHLLRK
jgi:hypothetical protein